MEKVIKEFLSQGYGYGSGSVYGYGSGSVYDGHGYGSGSVYGSVYGYGSGSVYGDGHGYGSGSVYGDGDGSGSVYGDGYGYGSSYGYGSGSVYGDGHGYGSGSVYGDGSGSVYGDGYGYGSSYGSGSGSVYGYGYGYGISAVNGQQIHVIDGVPTRIDKVKGEIARGAILNVDFTFTPCYIAKYNGYFGHGAHLGDALKAAIDKYEEDMSESDRIDAFVNAHKPDVSYPNSDFFKWHNKLTGSCEMGRRQFAKDHEIDLTERMTVQEFILLTENAYGGNIIKKLKPFYGMVERNMEGEEE